MWLADRDRGRSSEAASIGRVTIGGGNTAVVTDRERRGSVFFAPGGYYWMPSVGDSMVVIKSEDNEVCCFDREVREMPEGMSEGDVLITSGSAEIHIKKSGQIVIKGDVTVEGRLSVNGTEIG